MNTEAVIAHIVHWLADYNQKAGTRGFVVGVSGGIDSAVTATLCARTGSAVLALNMPIYQAVGQFRRADAHIHWLTENHANVSGLNLDLSRTLDAFAQTLPPAVQDELVMANTRSRLRMVTLYALAAHHRMLVAGTGNKVEDFGIGFFTKYGDGGVDLSPIADLTKSEVYAVGQALGVSEEIRQAPPTDGLWADNRTDETQIGATYKELEWAMQYDADPAAADEPTPRQREVLAIYHKFHEINRHKMEPIPVCKIPDRLRQSIG